MTDSARGVRLQRVMADAGVASRRECEALIETGHVAVNGQYVTKLPAWVSPEHDRIEVDGRLVQRPERHIYIMLNKPPRTVSTAQDEPGLDRRTVVDLVDHPARARLYPVGRLDYDTTGLVLLTNDGKLANKLTHPRYGIHKTYRAVVRGRVADDDVRELEKGIYLAERRDGQTVGAARTARVEISIAKRDRDRTTLQITLREGRNRQVRRMLAAVGCPVKKLERVAIGPLKLKGLARGQWRELERNEIASLRRAASRGARPSAAPARRRARSGGARTR